jgi:hypothetical protein
VGNDPTTPIDFARALLETPGKWMLADTDWSFDELLAALGSLPNGYALQASGGVIWARTNSLKGTR